MIVDLRQIEALKSEVGWRQEAGTTHSANQVVFLLLLTLLIVMLLRTLPTSWCCCVLFLLLLTLLIVLLNSSNQVVLLFFVVVDCCCCCCWPCWCCHFSHCQLCCCCCYLKWLLLIGKYLCHSSSFCWWWAWDTVCVLANEWLGAKFHEFTIFTFQAVIFTFRMWYFIFRLWWAFSFLSWREGTGWRQKRLIEVLFLLSLLSFCSDLSLFCIFFSILISPLQQKTSDPEASWYFPLLTFKQMCHYRKIKNRRHKINFN